MPQLPESWEPLVKTLGYESERAMLHDLYTVRGLSIAQLVKKLGYAQNNVRAHLMLAGIQLRPRGGPNALGKSKFRALSDVQLLVLKEGDIVQVGEVTVKVLHSTLYKEKRKRGLLKEPCTSAPSPQPLISNAIAAESILSSHSPSGALETHDTSSGIAHEEPQETL